MIDVYTNEMKENQIKLNRFPESAKMLKEIISLLPKLLKKAVYLGVLILLVYIKK